MKGRVTSKKMVDWCNEQFKKLEIKEWEVTNVQRTYYSSEQYEGGAAKLLVTFSDKDGNIGHFNSFYSMKEYQGYLEMGYEMYLRTKNRFEFLIDLNIDVRQKTTLKPPYSDCSK